jgi:hypothetical protein
MHTHATFLPPLPTGLVIRNIYLGPDVLGGKLPGLLDLRRVACKELSLKWPSWRYPLHLMVSGLDVELYQRQMPEVWEALCKDPGK